LILGDTLACFLRSPLASSQFEALSLGTAVPRLNLEDVRAIEIPLPPLAEQRRLVAKLDNLSAQSKRSRTHLDHVRRLVVKYKQAILAAAFRGDLTREWRVQHEDEPGPEARLKALHAERDGILGVHRRKSRTEDSGRIPMSLGILPERWATTTLEEITHPTRVIQYGILMPGPHVEGGVSYVKVMNIKGGRVQLERIRSTTPEIAHQYRRATILAGDILLTIRGTVGRLAIVPKELDGGNITQDTVRIVPLEGVEREFVFWYLHCPVVQQYFVRNQKGVAVRGINVGDVRLLEVPVPAREEQREIVKKIDAAFSWINRLSSDTLSARKLIDHLDQAVLAKAFQGELVPQDPSDEPASMLLERVTARRRAMPDLRDRNSEKRKTSRALRDA
jgi:type I restriction enzyme S subunit